jgi:rRNA maturation protein Nop10
MSNTPDERSCPHTMGSQWRLATMTHHCLACGAVLLLPVPPAYAHDDYHWRDVEEQEAP